YADYSALTEGVNRFTSRLWQAIAFGCSYLHSDERRCHLFSGIILTPCFSVGLRGTDITFGFSHD
ncbi:MAG: hypothetical protein J0L94_16800, partial [Rhodothermia bacterium]|nr:hypothetical protein [Rhodothermia bacterium]